MTETEQQATPTVEQKVSQAEQWYGDKFIREFEHILKVHPDAKTMIFIVREYDGAWLTVYDLEHSMTEPLFITGINAADWANLVTAMPGHGIALPLDTRENFYARLQEKIAADHEAGAAKVEA